MADIADEVSRREPRSVALVTGATGAIGRAIAERIAARPEYEVVLVCRDAAKAEKTVEAIRRRDRKPSCPLRDRRLVAARVHPSARRAMGRPRTRADQQRRGHTPAARGNTRGHRASVRHQCARLLLDDHRIPRSSCPLGAGARRQRGELLGRRAGSGRPGVQTPPLRQRRGLPTVEAGRPHADGRLRRASSGHRRSRSTPVTPATSSRP